MHLPMSNYEVSDFLKVSTSEVEALVGSGILVRSIGCPYRPAPGLNWSSIYDVLEYALSRGGPGIILKREYAAMWVFVLAEADEQDGFANQSLYRQASTLVAMAVADGFACDDDLALRTANQVLRVRAHLLGICVRGDKEATEVCFTN